MDHRHHHRPFFYSPSNPHPHWLPLPPPPAPPPPSAASLSQQPPPFMVELHSRCPFFPTPDLVSLINQCNPTPHNFFVNPTGLVAGILFFRHRTDAAEALVFFWERRIAGDHFMTPVSEVLDDELQERVKGLFVSHVESLLEGEVMQRMVKKREVLQNEAENLSARLRKPQKLGLLFGDLPGKAKGLRDEIGLITNRMEEFRSAMKWVLNYLQGNNSKDSVISGETEVFKFEDGLDLSRIHCIVMRECRRLEEGLPIYGFRLEIIRQVLLEQVMVLIGETGSGKSTQLVQFLADSGLGASGSMVCTQPRKIAAVSLAKRVGEETNGCYEGVSYNLERTEYGSYRVKISANATKAVAELRKPLEQLMKGKLVTHDSLTPTILQLLFSREGIMLMKSVQQETGTYIFFDRQNLNVRVFGSEDKVALAAKKLVQSLLTLREDKPLEIRLRNRVLPHDLMKKVVEKFGPDIRGLKEKVPEAELTLDAKHHVICVRGSKEVKQAAEKVIYEFACSLNVNDLEEHPGGEASTCPICLCEVEDSYQLAACGHEFCQSCLVEQLECAIKSRDGFPLGCAREMCGEHILLMDLRSLLSCEKLEELFRASLGAFVASSGGKYKFCPSPDCPSVYRVAEPGTTCWPFACGACYVETCTGCHLEYHPFMSCERYKEFKEDPDSSLKEWCQGKEHVKSCPVCGYMIEKVDGCNHIECRCGKHICWVCLECFCNSDDCYVHLRSIHHAII